jgi:hypothetical protein
MCLIPIVLITRTMRLVILPIFVVMMTAQAAVAICIVPPPVCQSYWEYEAVFDATARSIERIDLPMAGKITGHRLVTFGIHKAWKGVAGSSLQVVLPGGYEWQISESFEPTIGERYVVFARRGLGGYLTTSGCDPNQPHARAAEILEFLGTLEKPATGGRIFGRVELHDERTRNGTVPTTVSLHGDIPRRTLQAQDGTFEFTNLPPGQYRVSIDVPSGLRGDEEVLLSIVNRRACALASFVLRPSTRLIGTVAWKDGTPASHIRVEMAAVPNWSSLDVQPLTRTTDQNGEFEFTSVFAGRYVIGVNLKDLPRGPYRRTLFAGADGTPAQYEVRPDHVLRLGTLRVEGPLAEVPVTLQLIRDDGRPFENTHFGLTEVTDGTSGPPRIFFNWRTDASGRHTLRLHASRYVVVLPMSGTSGTEWRIASAPFTVDAQSTFVTVTLSSKGRQ